MKPNGHPIPDDTIVHNATEEEATGGLNDAGRFAMGQLQSSAQLARDIAGATVFMTVVLPIEDDSARARMISFSVGCNCPTCDERARDISGAMLEVTRDVSAKYVDRVALAHVVPTSDTPQ